MQITSDGTQRAASRTAGIIGRRRAVTVVRIITVVAVSCLGVACTSTRDASSTVDVAATTAAPSTVAETTTVAPAPATTVPESTTTVAPTTTTTTTTTPPTTTTAPLVTEGATIRVANATNVPGGAGRLTNELADVGYHMAEPTNAAGNEEFLDATKVYFLPDGEAVATGLAAVLGVPLARMPTPAPITDATVGLGDATVLVMLGKDLAGKTPPGLEGR